MKKSDVIRVIDDSIFGELIGVGDAGVILDEFRDYYIVDFDGTFQLVETENAEDYIEKIQSIEVGDEVEVINNFIFMIPVGSRGTITSIECDSYVIQFGEHEQWCSAIYADDFIKKVDDEVIEVGDIFLYRGQESMLVSVGEIFLHCVNLETGNIFPITFDSLEIEVL